jgi:hypothetical protein
MEFVRSALDDRVDERAATTARAVLAEYEAKGAKKSAARGAKPGTKTRRKKK